MMIDCWCFLEVDAREDEEKEVGDAFKYSV